MQPEPQTRPVGIEDPPAELTPTEEALQRLASPSTPLAPEEVAIFRRLVLGMPYGAGLIPLRPIGPDVADVLLYLDRLRGRLISAARSEIDLRNRVAHLEEAIQGGARLLDELAAVSTRRALGRLTGEAAGGEQR